MKNKAIASLPLFGACLILNADEINYTLSAEVWHIQQTDLEPESQWNSSVFIGAQATILITLSSTSPVSPSYPGHTFLDTAQISIAVGDYSFTTILGRFEIYDYRLTILKNGPLGYVDGIGFYFDSSESYFGDEQNYVVSGRFSTTNLDYVYSTDPISLPSFFPGSVEAQESNLISIDGQKPGHPYVGEKIGYEGLRLRILNAQAGVIPEPSTSVFCLGLFALVYAFNKRKRG